MRYETGSNQIKSNKGIEAAGQAQFKPHPIMIKKKKKTTRNPLNLLSIKSNLVILALIMLRYFNNIYQR